jgi:hypothetical protein
MGMGREHPGAAGLHKGTSPPTQPLIGGVQHVFRGELREDRHTREMMPEFRNDKNAAWRCRLLALWHIAAPGRTRRHVRTWRKQTAGPLARPLVKRLKFAWAAVRREPDRLSRRRIDPSRSTPDAAPRDGASALNAALARGNASALNPSRWTSARLRDGVAPRARNRRAIGRSARIAARALTNFPQRQRLSRRGDGLAT